MKRHEKEWLVAEGTAGRGHASVPLPTRQA